MKRHVRINNDMQAWNHSLTKLDFSRRPHDYIWLGQSIHTFDHTLLKMLVNHGST